MYKHGVSAIIAATLDSVAPKGVGTLSVYIGTAAMHQIPKAERKINKPIIISTYNEAVKKLGYSENWSKYTLSEAIYAHFKNPIVPIAPFVVINALQVPENVPNDKEEQVIFINHVGTIKNENIIIETIEIANKILNDDYTVSYNSDGSAVIIKDITNNMRSEIVKFAEMNAVTTTDNIIQAIEIGIPLIYQSFNLIPTLFNAPGFTDNKEVTEALINASYQINGHWYGYVNADITADNVTDTVEKAIEKKKIDNLIHNNLSICWPKYCMNGRIFNLSTLTTMRMQITDWENDNIPFETPSNKPIGNGFMCDANGKEIDFDQLEANKLNAAGIKTMTFWGGNWVLWGPHNAIYEYGKDMDNRDIFDSSIRTLYYIANSFQRTYGVIVDKPMKRSLVETTLNDFQEFLDRMVSRGALLSAKMEFNESSNPIDDMVQGEFVFDIATTTTPPAKSVTTKIRYTSAGISMLFGGEQ